MTHPDFELAQQYALERLERELSPRLVYHSLWHTRDEVVPAVERLAALEGVTSEALLLLRTGAWYHDIGCLVQRPDHEAIGVGIAYAALPRFGYSAEHLRVITGLILATKLPQTPHTLLEEILADADLDVLGREDFFARSAALRAETEALGQPTTDAGWNQGQQAFLQNHRYFTPSAHRLRDPQKAQNVLKLSQMLG